MWTAVRPTGAEAVKMVSYELSKPLTRLQSPELKLQCLHRRVFSLLSTKETCSIPFSRYHATGKRPGIGITLGRVALRLFRDNWSPSENSWAGVLFCNSHCVNVGVNSKPGIEIAYQQSVSLQKSHALRLCSWEDTICWTWGQNMPSVAAAQTFSKSGATRRTSIQVGCAADCTAQVLGSRLAVLALRCSPLLSEVLPSSCPFSYKLKWWGFLFSNCFKWHKKASI